MYQSKYFWPFLVVGRGRETQLISGKDIFLRLIGGGF